MFFDRFGPHKTIILGCIIGFVGWGFVWLFTDHRLDSSQASMASLYFVATNAQTWFDTGALITNIGNFPADRSLVIGLEKSYTGLGASILSELYTALFRTGSTQDGVSPFLLMICCTFAVVPLAMSYFLVPQAESAASALEPKRLRFLTGYALTIILALALLVASLVQHFFDVSPAVKYVLFAICMLLLASQVLIVFVGRNKADQFVINDSSQGELVPLLSAPQRVSVRGRVCD